MVEAGGISKKKTCIYLQKVVLQRLIFISTTKQAIDMAPATKLIRKIERRWPAKKLSDLVKLVVTCPQSQ
jgi:hypothetical protein